VSIYRRGDGRWVGSLDLGRDAAGKRQRHVVYGQLRREVVAKLEEARSRLAADEPVRDARTTVASFVTDWLEKALPASGRRATTQATYAALARTHLTPAPFGALPLDRLRPSDIEALLLAKRDAGLATRTPLQHTRFEVGGVHGQQAWQPSLALSNSSESDLERAKCPDHDGRGHLLCWLDRSRAGFDPGKLG
jgi:hypothetical protein